MTGSAQCGRCGAPVEVGAQFCGRCGVDVTTAQDPDATVALTAAGSSSPPADSGVTLRTRLREATLGEYEILDELGRGGMATVFRAHDISLDRKVAIKVMAPHLLEGEGMVERFKLEARTAAQLSHPHIIPIYAVKESDATLFFVMKYVDGRALDEIIARTGQLPIAMVKDILIKVGGALGYAHRRGVVHRDVKPGNIMIDDEGTPIVTDFGIAKLTSGATGLTVTGTTIGTPSYMSPEQCEAKEVTGASDQYSLGIVAFQMLTGRLPYEGDSAVTVMYKHCHEDLPPLGDYRPDCPSDLLETVTRMVAKDPAARWPSMEAAIQKLSVNSTSEAYLDPIRKELIQAAKEGDFERLAELSTGGTSAAKGASTTGAAPDTPAASAGVGGRRLGLVAAVVLVLGSVGTLAVLQPWASGESTPAESLVGPGSNSTSGATEGLSGPGGPAAEGVAGGGEEGQPTVAQGGDAGSAGGDPADDQIQAGGEAGAPGAAGPDTPADAEAGGGTQPARVVVRDVRVSGPGSLVVGESGALSATALDEGGATIPESTVANCQSHGWSACGVQWSSDAPDIVDVSSEGSISARAPGSATVSATIGGETGRWLVEVSAVPAAEVRINPPSLRVSVGSRERAEATAVAASGEVLGGRPARWTSSNPAVVDVNPSGMVEGVAPGRASLTASVDGATGTLEVLVVEDVGTAIPRLVEAFGAALAQEDIAAAKALFPTMPTDREENFVNLFEQVQMRDVRLQVEDITTAGESATAVLRGVYALEDPRAGSQELPIVLNAGFALTDDGVWRISGWDNVGGG